MRKRTILFAGIALCLIGAAIAFYFYSRPRAGVDRQEAAYRLTAAELFRAYQQNEQQAEALYGGKVLEVTGTVETAEASPDGGASVQLSSGEPIGGVNCSMAPGSASLPQKGATVRIKGRCVGFLMDVNLVDGVVSE